LRRFERRPAYAGTACNRPPCGLIDIVHGRLGVFEYLHSLKRVDTEAVFSWHDPMPGLSEVALIPYLYFRRGF